jgi:uncharacterized protein (DUF427 family)
MVVSVAGFRPHEQSWATMTRATWRGAVIADSDDVEVVDGYTHFPADTVDHRYRRASSHHTTCPWKGTASYFDVVVDDHVNAKAAWRYPQPSDRAAPLVAGRIGLWRGVKIERDHGDERPIRVARLFGRR